MQVSLIKIENILGIDSLEFEPGKLTEISGKNASGKTSVLEAIKSVLQGGRDATLLRNGEQKGSVVLVLEDETELKRTITEKTNTLSAKRDGMLASSPAKFIDNLTDTISINPVSFLTASAKDRTRVLLESLPMKADVKAITKIVGPGFDHEGHALVVIETIEKQLFDERTGINRAAKEKSGSIASLKEAVGDDEQGEDLAESKAKLTATMDELRTEKINAKESLDDQVKQGNSIIDQEILTLQDQINDLRANQKDREIQAGQDWATELESFNLREAKIQHDIDSIDNKITRQAETQAARNLLATHKTDFEGLTKESEGLTKSITDLRDYKQNLLSELPINGVEIVEGAIHLNGVPFDRANGSEKVRAAVAIARLRAGEIGLVCVDGLELLDTKSYAAFKKAAEASDLQMIITRVTDDALSVKSV